MKIAGVLALSALSVWLFGEADAPKPADPPPSYLSDVQLEEAGYPVERPADPVLAGDADQPQDPAPVLREPPKPRYVHLQWAARTDGEVAASLMPKITEWGSHLTDAQIYDIAMAIARNSRQYDIRPEVIAALIQVESNYHPGAKSPTSDHGLTQLHKRPIYGINENIAAGCEHLRMWIDHRNGDLKYGLSSYNGGTYPPGVSWGYADKVLRLSGEVYE